MAPGGAILIFGGSIRRYPETSLTQIPKPAARTFPWLVDRLLFGFAPSLSDYLHRLGSVNISIGVR